MCLGYCYKERIPIERVGKLLRHMLRGDLSCVLVNLSHKVMIDMGYDYYMHVLCPLQYEVLQEIVTSHDLYLNPRRRRFLKLNLNFMRDFTQYIINSTDIKKEEKLPDNSYAIYSYVIMFFRQFKNEK